MLFEVGASIRERYKAMAKQCADQLLFRAIELANSCDLNYKVSRNKRLLLELTLIQLCQLTQVEESKKKALIEPLAPTASAPATAPLPSAVSAQPTTPRPVTTTVPPTVQPPSQAVPPTTSSRPVVTPTPTAAPSEKRISRPMGLSLREMREGPSKPAMQSAPTATVRENLDTPFTEESLRTAWTQFAQSIEKEVHLKHTMLNCEPKLLDPHLFEVVVHNPAQQDELLQKTLSILSFIRKQLRNSHVQLRVRIEEGNKKQIAVTSAEKFALLLKINPALGKLKEEFDLKLD